ncbi:hypothetical protein B0H66DRAFT_567468 [Apodospora peruviana]|uniref:Uncharacterized protein n=1 Tax=Apodospora peruviana TaxID=516989 RepID=A0AAE0HW15_9PEZI|nr:hypothetical protein B0H66DRAFT_567468 [Apodospora peruviana]
MKSKTNTAQEEPDYRELALKAKQSRQSLDTLDDAHRVPLTRAISNVLTTEIAETTYAQIIDGLPLASVADDTPGGILSPAHPINRHKTLCPGALDKTRLFRAEFDPGSLRFDASLLSAYQATTSGSAAFGTRLIEMVAIAVHQIAAVLFQLEASGHKDDGVTDWAPRSDDELWWRINPDGPLPTLFCHSWYVDYEQYPDGVADVVGYWAENRILGGVVLFDRNDPVKAEEEERKDEEESDDDYDLPPHQADPNAVYLHPERGGNVPYRICKLLDNQKEQLLAFLLAAEDMSDNDSSYSCPLPILVGGQNTERVDPEEPIHLTGIYRDEWERNLQPEYMGDNRSRDVFSLGDWVSFAEWNHSRERWMTRFRRYPEWIQRQWEGRVRYDHSDEDDEIDETST